MTVNLDVRKSVSSLSSNVLGSGKGAAMVACVADRNLMATNKSKDDEIDYEKVN